MKGWHFLRKDRRLRYDDGRLVRAGRTYRAKGDLVLCKKGMHASRRLIDALHWAPGPIVCRVELTGELIHDDDKSVGRSRTVLWMLDATLLLHEFACRCAEDALALTKNPDPRRLEVVRIKRLWLAGKAGDEALAEAAWDAAGAARYAAWATAEAAWYAKVAAGVAQNRRLTAMVAAARQRGE